MRYKNLTITITLGCLSLVALASLVMLPISSGVCEWTGDKSVKSFYTNLYDSLGKGWHLSASLNASNNCASANVQPSIYGEKAHTAETTYSGTANVYAYRNAGWANIHFYCQTLEESEERHGSPSAICFGHYETRWIEGVEDKNTDQGEEQTIVAKVAKIEYWVVYQITRTESNGTSTTIGGTVDIEVSETTNLSLGASHTWTGSDGLSYSGLVGNKTPKYREDKNEGQSQSAYVASYENLRCGASTCISFYHVSESESVVHNENVVHVK